MPKQIDSGKCLMLWQLNVRGKHRIVIVLVCDDFLQHAALSMFIELTNAQQIGPVKWQQNVNCLPLECE